MQSALQSAPTLTSGPNRGHRRIGLIPILVLVGVLAPPAAILLSIHRYGVNVPFWDEWDELRVVPKAYDGTLDLAVLFAQQNEHRPVTSKLASVILAKTTQLNLVDQMYWGFAFQVLSLILMWRMLSSGLKGRASVLVGPLTIIASMLLFWTVAFENWTWGIASFQYNLSVFLAVLSVWGLTSWPGRWNGLAIACVATALAIYTNGIGFALIPVGILGILATRKADRREPWPQLCLFLAVAAACTALYFRNYVPPANAAALISRIRPGGAVKYFLTYLGSPFWTTRGGVAFSFGLVGLGGISACAYYIIRFMPGWLDSATPWLLLASYSVINGAITTVARVDFGIEQALAPRYRSIVVLLWVSLIVTLSMIALHISPRFDRATITAALVTAVIIFIGGYSYLYYRGWRHIQIRSQMLAGGLPYVIDYDRAPDDKLQIFHPDPSTVRDLARKLEQHHLGPFAVTSARRGVN